MPAAITADPARGRSGRRWLPVLSVAAGSNSRPGPPRAATGRCSTPRGTIEELAFAQFDGPVAELHPERARGRPGTARPRRRARARRTALELDQLDLLAVQLADDLGIANIEGSASLSARLTLSMLETAGAPAGAVARSVAAHRRFDQAGLADIAAWKELGHDRFEVEHRSRPPRRDHGRATRGAARRLPQSCCRDGWAGPCHAARRYQLSARPGCPEDAGPRSPPLTRRPDGNGGITSTWEKASSPSSASAG